MGVKQFRVNFWITQHALPGPLATRRQHDVSGRVVLDVVQRQRQRFVLADRGGVRCSCDQCVVIMSRGAESRRVSVSRQRERRCWLRQGSCVTCS